MVLENAYTDIFTEFDESIFSDGSIDPMGLRIIWTSLGNAVFHNKLNTISTDIRYYTLNLFHHYVIQNAESRNEDKLFNRLGKAPYFNKQDFDDGLVIFLESLLTHAVYRINNKGRYFAVPGISKLSGILAEAPDDERAIYLTVERRTGILIRHILLGIHGRHKGPFQQMGIFQQGNYYADKTVWNEAGQLFDRNPWDALAGELADILTQKVFDALLSAKGAIKIPVEEVLNEKLLDLYEAALEDKNFREQEMISFWEKRLGLLEGAARILYEELKEFIHSSGGENLDYEKIIKSASGKGDPVFNKYIKAICAIEPLIAGIERMANRLLQRGTSEIDSALEEFALKVLEDNNINLSLIAEYLTTDYLTQEALNRLKKLYTIYAESRQAKTPEKFIQSLIEYHKNIMESRNNMAWLSYGNNKITQHRSFNYSAKSLEEMEASRWVNNYYLSTVHSLYKGLYQQ